MTFVKLVGVILVLALDYVYGKVVSGSFSDVIGFANNVVDGQSANQLPPDIPVGSIDAGNSYKNLMTFFEKKSPYNNVQKDRKIKPAETVKSDSPPTSSSSIIVAPETDAVLLKAKMNKFVLIPIQVVNGKRIIIGNIKQYPALDDKPIRRRASFPVFKRKKKMKVTSHEKKQRRYYMKNNDNITVMMQKENVTFSKDDLDIKPIDESPVFILPLFVEVYGNKKYSREKEIDAIIKANLDGILTEHVKKQNMTLTSMIMDQSNDRDIRVVDSNDSLLNNLLSIPSKAKEDSNAVHIRQKRIRRSDLKNSTI